MENEGIHIEGLWTRWRTKNIPTYIWQIVAYVKVPIVLGDDWTKLHVHVLDGLNEV